MLKSFYKYTKVLPTVHTTDYLRQEWAEVPFQDKADRKDPIQVENFVLGFFGCFLRDKKKN